MSIAAASESKVELRRNGGILTSLINFGELILWISGLLDADQAQWAFQRRATEIREWLRLRPTARCQRSIIRGVIAFYLYVEHAVPDA
jgi:hypothetical protein